METATNKANEVKARELWDEIELDERADDSIKRIAAALTTAYEAGLERAAMIVDDYAAQLNDNQQPVYLVKSIASLASDIRAAKETK